MFAIAFGLGCWAGYVFGNARGYRAGMQAARIEGVVFLTGLASSLGDMRSKLETGSVVDGAIVQRG